MWPLALGFVADPFACRECDILSNALNAFPVVLMLSHNNAVLVSRGTFL